jgi:hypothetical protein
VVVAHAAAADQVNPRVVFERLFGDGTSRKSGSRAASRTRAFSIR